MLARCLDAAKFAIWTVPPKPQNVLADSSSEISQRKHRSPAVRLPFSCEIALVTVICTWGLDSLIPRDYIAITKARYPNCSFAVISILNAIGKSTTVPSNVFPAFTAYFRADAWAAWCSLCCSEDAGKCSCSMATYINGNAYQGF